MVTGSVPVRYKFLVENKGWESGPGRNRTCDLADEGSIPAWYQYGFFENQNLIKCEWE